LAYAAIILAAPWSHAAEGWGLPMWCALIFTGFAWPQLIWLWVNSRTDRVEAVHTSMTLDWAMVGFWCAAVHWEGWLGFAMITSATLNTIIVSGPRRYLRGVALGLCVAILTTVWTGGVVDARPSSPVVSWVSGVGVWAYAAVLVTEGYRRALALRRVRKDLRETNQRLAQLASQLRKYLPDPVYQAFFAGEANTARAPERLQLTVLFADICGFTAVSDEQPVELVARDINFYLERMAQVAEAEGGTVDKFIGDAIMVIFGAPSSAGPVEDARRALRTGLAMQRESAQLREVHPDAPLLGALRIRVGVHSGTCAVGNFGAENRLDYTAVGRTVNIASRLEGAAQPGEVLCSRACAELAGPAEQDSRGPLSLK